MRRIAASALSFPPDTARTVGLYGTGRQADAQIEAICAVRPIRSVKVFGRDPDRRASFCAQTSKRLGIEIIPVATPQEVVSGSEIIVTITKPETPILFGEWLKAPALVVAAEANRRYKREIDSEVTERANLVVVDEVEQSKIEGGNLLWPMAHGKLNWNQVEELGDVVIGRVPVSDPANNLILFESHGLAIEDVAISKIAFDLAKALALDHFSSKGFGCLNMPSSGYSMSSEGKCSFREY